MAYPPDLFYDRDTRRLGCSDLEQRLVPWTSLCPDVIAGDVDKLDQSVSLGAKFTFKHTRVAEFNSGYAVCDSHRSIAHQLHDLNTSIAALLETGCKFQISGALLGKYLRFTSARDQDGHACELLISLAIPYATVDDHDVYFDENSMGILVSQSRYLAMRVSTFCLDFIAIAFHAPHAKHMDECKAWWHQCINQTLLLQRSHPCLDCFF